VTRCLSNDHVVRAVASRGTWKRECDVKDIYSRALSLGAISSGQGGCEGGYFGSLCAGYARVEVHVTGKEEDIMTVV
jgi:hypothetical protein